MPVFKVKATAEVEFEIEAGNVEEAEEQASEYIYENYEHDELWGLDEAIYVITEKE